MLKQSHYWKFYEDQLNPHDTSNYSYDKSQYHKILEDSTLNSSTYSNFIFCPLKLVVRKKYMNRDEIEGQSIPVVNSKFQSFRFVDGQ